MQEIQTLKRQGLSISAISALTGFDRKTVRKYLAEAAPVPAYGPRTPRPSKLEPFRHYLDSRLQAGVWNAQVLLRELREQGYPGGYTLVKDYLQPRRQAAREVAVRRFETPAGHQAQVDWGDLGHLESPDGRQPLYGFVLTLGYSRAMFAQLATDQTLSTLLSLHEAAFHALGGVPREILYDRMKTVVLGVDERGEIRWHPLFQDFARYWGFTPRLCRAYRPQTKGKVESGIKYVRRNFLCGRTATSLSDLQDQLRVWTAEVALPRVHGTTHRVVREAWEEERPHLLPVRGRPPFPHCPALVRRVSRDAFVSYRSNRYSVPWTAVGQEVTLRERGGELEIELGGVRLACHPLCLGKHQVRTVPAHHDGLPEAVSERPGGKTRITVPLSGPEVEVRSLSAYEALAGVAA
ncbi:MAG: IS21 family transposase [Armatimonadota bacterium]